MWKMWLFTFSIWLMIAAVLFGLTGYEVRQEQRDRALIAAVAQGNAAKVAALLAQGADANTRELAAQSQSPWHWLLTKGRPDAGHTIPTRSALLVAVEGSYFPTFPVRTTPDNPELVAALLRAGADVSARDEAGNPALLYAALNQDRTVVSLLLSYGADVNMRLADGSTLLMTLIGSGNADPRILSEIAERSNIDARDNAGRTSLMVAVLNGNVAGVRLLLTRHADPDQPDCKGENPITLAYRAYRDEPTPVHQQIIRLLRQGASSRQTSMPAEREPSLQGV
jgi:ankyrin repeat protein